MGRILGIDFGTKRVGMSVTDPLQIAVNGLTTVPATKAVSFILNYVEQETVDKIVIGKPWKPSKSFQTALKRFVHALKKACPEINLAFEEEDYTSSDAMDIIRQAGVKRKDRRSKELIDQVSAVLILQQHLGHLN